MTAAEADFAAAAKISLELAHMEREQLVADNDRLKRRIAELEKLFEQAIEMLVGYADVRGLTLGVRV